MIETRWIQQDDALYQQEVDLRERVLFQPINYSYKQFCIDFGCEDRFHHLVAIEEDTVIGCLALLPGDDPTRVKLMQMVVDDTHQGRGVGRILVVEAERYAKHQLNANTLWCHARNLAYGFYQRLGWTFSGDPFTEVNIVHREMSRALG